MNEEKPINHLEKFVTSVITALDIEIARLTETKDQIRIIERLAQFYHSKNIYDFFVMVNIKNTTLEFIGDETLREFILNFSDRASYLVSLEDIDYNIVKDKLVEAICRNKPQDEASSLINTEVVQTLYINPEVLKELFTYNFWLIVLYTAIMFFQQSDLYSSIHEAKPKTNINRGNTNG